MCVNSTLDGETDALCSLLIATKKIQGKSLVTTEFLALDVSDRIFFRKKSFVKLGSQCSRIRYTYDTFCVFSFLI